jgi:hypothetical protein
MFQNMIRATKTFEDLLHKAWEEEMIAEAIATLDKSIVKVSERVRKQLNGKEKLGYGHETHIAYSEGMRDGLESAKEILQSLEKGDKSGS